MKYLIVAALFAVFFPVTAMADTKLPSYIERVGIADCDKYIEKGWACRVQQHCEGNSPDPANKEWCGMSWSHLSMVSGWWVIKKEKDPKALELECKQELKKARENKQWKCDW
jgi:hypothetical protein